MAEPFRKRVRAEEASAAESVSSTAGTSPGASSRAASDTSSDEVRFVPTSFNGGSDLKLAQAADLRAFESSLNRAVHVLHRTSDARLLSRAPRPPITKTDADKILVTACMRMSRVPSFGSETRMKGLSLLECLCIGVE